jgi:hypothetical protein
LNERVPDTLDEFLDHASRIVWCTMATVDHHGRPRSRLVHPVWHRDGDGPLQGWLLTRRNLKLDHIEGRPFASCHYWDPAQHTAIAECRATACQPAEAWARALAAPEPMGYDPATLPLWDSPDDPGCGAIRLDPWLVRVWTIGRDPVLWRAGERTNP